MYNFVNIKIHYSSGMGMAPKFGLWYTVYIKKDFRF